MHLIHIDAPPTKSRLCTRTTRLLTNHRVGSNEQRYMKSSRRFFHADNKKQAMLDHVSTTRYNTKLGSNDQAMAPGPIQDNHRTTSPTCVPNIRDSWGKISTLEQVAAHHHGTERRAKKELQWNGPNTYNRTNWKILQGVVTEKTNGAFSPRQSSQQQRNKHGRKKKKKSKQGAIHDLLIIFSKSYTHTDFVILPQTRDAEHSLKQQKQHRKLTG